MKIVFFSPEKIQLMPGLTSDSLQKLEEPFDFAILGDSLAIIQKDKPLAKFAKGHIHYTFFAHKLILSSTNTDSVKNIIFELEVNDESEQVKLKKLIKRHNKLSMYKDPLRTYTAVTIRESILALTEQPSTNLRGFVNLLIVYSIISYSRNILEHFIYNGPLFIDYV